MEIPDTTEAVANRMKTNKKTQTWYIETPNGNIGQVISVRVIFDTQWAKVLEDGCVMMYKLDDLKTVKIEVIE